MIEICFEKNLNLTYFKKTNENIYIIIEEFEYFKNIQFALKKNKLVNQEFIFGSSIENVSLFGLNGAAELMGRGWEKEAIPVIQSKKSLISSLFYKLFS